VRDLVQTLSSIEIEEESCVEMKGIGEEEVDG